MLLIVVGHAAATADKYKRWQISTEGSNGAPVVPFGDTLFFVYGNLGSMTAQKRAALIAENISGLEKDLVFIPDSLVVVADEDQYNVVCRSKIIIGVTERQARNFFGISAEELAQEYRNIISDAVKEVRSEQIWLIVLRQVGLSILILAAVFFGIKYLNILYRKVRVIIRNSKNKAFKLLYNVLDADKQVVIGLWILKIIRLLCLIAILYICMLAFFGLFPATRWLSSTLIGYIINPLKVALLSIWNFLPDLFAIIVIIALFRLIAKGLRIVAGRIAAGSIVVKGFHADWAITTYQIIRTILVIFMFIFIYPHLPHSNSEVFKGVSVFMGVLFSLGSTSIISNIVSGLVITYMRPFKVGDRIKMGEYLGNVVEKTSLVTRIKTPKNEIVTIPNSAIMTAQTVNYTCSAKEYGLILYIAVTVGYEMDWRKVHEMLIEAGLKTPYVLQEPKPFVLQTAFDDFYVEYQINVYTTEANEMANTYSELRKNIQDIFNREGVEIMSPHVVAHRDASAMAMPKEYVRPGQEQPVKVAMVREDKK